MINLFGKKKDLIWRGIMLVAAAILTFFYPHETITFFNGKIIGVNIYQILWFIIILILLRMLVPKLSTQSVGSRKAFLRIVESTDKTRLDKLTAESNRRALKAGLYWTLLIATVGALYLFGIISLMGIFLSCAFFIYMDSFCVHVWCPFRNWIIKNKCCNSCRIYRWGAFMACLPLVFIPSFWTYSILVISFAVLIQWEYMFAKYPERFFELTNPMLRCNSCPKKCPNCILNRKK